MKYLELTFADPAQNLACDEALLEWFEGGGDGDGLLRVWQPENYFVVLGHSNRLLAEVNIQACHAAEVQILRRVSGGGTVLQGPGCLNYSLLLEVGAHGVKNIEAAFRYVLEHHRQLLSGLVCDEVRIEGTSDLTLKGRKVSGNAQYRKFRYVLVHGTFLLNFDLSMIEHCLHLPEKQPKYRANRPHRDFLTNLGLDGARVRAGLRERWRAEQHFNSAPLERIEQLVKMRYERQAWTEKF